MRLIRLRIKNVASLKGEHLIDFEAIEAQSPLFAITGETGAGKSSILTSIGTALYGKNHKNLTYDDLVTLGEKDAEIKLIFQVDGNFYLGEWYNRVRSQSGELLKQSKGHQYIFRLDGNTFDSPRGERIESIANLLNLTFEQFCKCIILNQGEFARFLTSSFTDRKKILERLYDGEMLDNLSKRLSDETKSFEKEKNDVELRLGEYKSDPLNGTDLMQERDSLKARQSLSESWQNHLNTLADFFTSLSFHFDKYHENRLKLTTLKKDLSDATVLQNDSLRKVEIAQNALDEARKRDEKERPRLQELRDLEVELKHTEVTLAEKDKSFAQTIEQLNAIQSSLAKKEENFIHWKLEHETFLRSFHRPVDELRNQREKLQRSVDLFKDLQGLRVQTQDSEENLKREETRGQGLKSELNKIEEVLQGIPTDLDGSLQLLEKQKSDLLKRKELENDKNQCLKFEQDAINEILALTEKLNAQTSALFKYEQELATLSATLKLVELKSSIEICLEHADAQKLSKCPVCETSLSSIKWNELLADLKKADVNNSRSRSMELTELIANSRADIKSLTHQRAQKENDLTLLQEKLKNLNGLPEIQVTSESLDQETIRLIELRARRTQLQNTKIEKESDLIRARETWGNLNLRNLENKRTIMSVEAQIEEFYGEILTLDKAQSLREDLNLLPRLQNSEGRGEKLQQEITFDLKEKIRLEALISELQMLRRPLSEKVSRLKETLQNELGGKSPQALIELLVQELKDLMAKKEGADLEFKKHDSEIVKFRAIMHSLNELLENYDRQFQQNIHDIRNAALIPLPSLQENIDSLVSRLKDLTLGLDSPRELYLPIQERLTQEKEAIKEDCNKLHADLGSVIQRLSEWEKRQDKVRVLELTRDDIVQKLSRHLRLGEVLGKDELRSFVLSLVEENLILQTNEELNRLCQGRYEIIHQTRGQKMTPEFYILDKFREGGRRKVSTLSGGETFMVSLAMALALAEMTRGKAQIDSLFIDEGFGSLDHDSLEDVLDMLNQIQNRGLLVGIISHIKTLTEAIPVNLHVLKKQDGTSNLSMKFN